ncbi:MerR family transcriptional regulator [Sciscionella sediminilitoris]|uniref:MerR family transcriptional regulator n=1 Tax=Sciscionella sediminilitoris TaxID=1445613 RepID=UPI000689F254|nr:MerR family transcriptional regulator [Sciscionella sp. SE31]
MNRALSTAAVSAATGYSAQQIRDLEAIGVLPAAERADNGYRRFFPVHVRDLHAYRDLAAAMGPVVARATMREIRALPSDEAAALVCSLHARLNEEREQTLAARNALQAIHAEAVTEAAATEADAPTEKDAMTIRELAGALGVRASTLRFWETAGLVHPERIASAAGSVRSYPLAAIHEARITAALRAAGYRIPDVQRALAAIRGLRDTEPSLAALDERIAAIGARARALLRAGTTLAAIIEGTV